MIKRYLSSIFLASSFFVLFCLSGFAVADQQEDQVINLLKQVTEALKSQKEASGKFEAELKGFNKQITRLVSKDLSENQKQLAASKKLINDNLGKKEIEVQVSELRDAVFAYEVALNRDAFIGVLAIQLKQAFEKPEPLAKFTGETRASIRNLHAIIDKSEEEDKIAAVKHRAVELDGLIKEENQITNGDVRVSALSDLEGTLLLIDAKKHGYISALERRVSSLSGMLEPENKVKPILGTEHFISLQGLKTEIDEVLKGRSILIRVLSAYYGRIAGPSHENCNVSNAIGNKCNKNNSCDITKDVIAALCGGKDPYPWLFSDLKGLKVRYSCDGYVKTSVLHSAGVISCE